MWFLEHGELVSAFIAVCVLILPVYVILRRIDFNLNSHSAISLWFCVWIAAVSFEYYFLGPYSFIPRVSDSYFFAFNYFLANSDNVGTFSHLFGGGQDTAMLISSGMLFSFERFAAEYLAPWQAYLAHKVFIAGLGVLGGYLLGTRVIDVDSSPAAPMIALVSALALPISHVYITDYSVEFGTGFLSIPIALAAATARSTGVKYWLFVIIAGVFVALAQPMKVLPALAVAAIAMIIFLGERRYVRILFALTIYVGLAALNWSESIYALSNIAPHSARGFGADEATTDILASFLKLQMFLWPASFPSFIILAGSILIWIWARPMFFRSIGAFVSVAALFLLLDVFPWEIVGLGILNRIEYGYVNFATNVLSIAFAARGLDRWYMATGGTTRFDYLRGLMAISICVLLWVKILHGALFLAHGGQSSVFGYAKIADHVTLGPSSARVVSIMDAPHPSVVSGIYGLPDFGGNILLNPKPWNDYWNAIHGEKDVHRRASTRGGLDWSLWDGLHYHVDKALDVALLRRANVAYILSPLPLSGPSVEPLHTVPRVHWPNLRRQDFDSLTEYLMLRLARIFDPGEHHVYTIKGTVDRVRPAYDVRELEAKVSTSLLIESIKRLDKGTVLVDSGQSGILSPAQSLKVEHWTVVDQGYDIEVDAPDGGVLIINQYFSRNWTAEIDAQEVQLLSANHIEMALPIPPAAKAVRLRYKRKTLWP